VRRIAGDAAERVGDLVEEEIRQIRRGTSLRGPAVDAPDRRGEATGVVDRR
jgi:hypothetical protein